jgi:hypothetical protein
MENNSLNDTEIDVARRIGRTSGLLALLKVNPSGVEKVPNWVRICLRQIGEATVQGGGAPISDVFKESTELSYRSAGFALGNLGSLMSVNRVPIGRFGSSINVWLEEYFRAYFETVFQGAPPTNFWQTFILEIVGVMLTGNYEQRLEFIDGIRIGSDVENTFRSGETRETTATRIYFELVLFWPEVTRMEKLPAVFVFLQTRFSESPGQLGDFERFRKLANRIELSFQST